MIRKVAEVNIESSILYLNDHMHKFKAIADNVSFDEVSKSYTTSASALKEIELDPEKGNDTLWEAILNSKITNGKIVIKKRNDNEPSHKDQLVFEVRS